jgi:hypothetical protein
MKWGDWQSKRDTPWEAIVGIAVIFMMALSMFWLGENARTLGGWLGRLLEVLG